MKSLELARVAAYRKAAILWLFARPREKAFLEDYLSTALRPIPDIVLNVLTMASVFVKAPIVEFRGNTYHGELFVEMLQRESARRMVDKMGVGEALFQRFDA